MSYDDYNLATIVVFPPYQRKRYGMLMIEFSELKRQIRINTIANLLYHRLRVIKESRKAWNARTTIIGTGPTIVPHVLDSSSSPVFQVCDLL